MEKLTLVAGSEGLVGSRFVEISEVKNTLHFPKQIEMDILNPIQVRAIINSFDFGTIVNFAAFTDVSGAEGQRGNKNGDCWKINVEGVRNLVNAVKDTNKDIRFIQISTDYVFSGRKEDSGPYSEDHNQEEDEKKLTWMIYPVRANFPDKLDYLRKPLKLFDEGKLYPLFSNQQISTTFVDEACRVLDKVITGKMSGTFHVCSRDTTTPYELISYMLEKTGRDSSLLKKTTIEDFLEKYNVSSLRYPKYGGLRVEKTEEALNMKLSTWKQVVDELVDQGLGK
jgi:dTDP-4-dehydrorhamnose reductase